MTEPKCDFCSQRPVCWRYPTRTFTRVERFAPGAIIAARMHGDWAACQECHLLIQREDRVGLHQRSVATLPSLQTLSRSLKRQMSKHVRALHDDFWRNREGAPVEVPQ